MMSARRLAQMARKWLRVAAAGRKRIPFPRGSVNTNATVRDSDAPGSAPLAGKGHFIVYSVDGHRFEVPLAYLKSDIFGELLGMSEDVFGLPGAGPITLPCDAASLGSVLSCLRRRSSRDAERRLLASMAARPCSASFAPCPLDIINRELVACGC